MHDGIGKELQWDALQLQPPTQIGICEDRHVLAKPTHVFEKTSVNTQIATTEMGEKQGGKTGLQAILLR